MEKVTKTWECQAEWNCIGSRKDLESKLKLGDGEYIEEVEMSCSFKGLGVRTERQCICGDDDNSIKEKALKYFCGIYVEALLENSYDNISISFLSNDEDALDYDASWVDLLPDLA